MKLSERYKDANDAYQQLHNTYVELNGELCHLNYVDGWKYNIKRVVEKFGKRSWGRASMGESIKNEDLLLEPIKLGYMNERRSAVYAQRKPLRKWKQGIYIEYLEDVDPTAKGEVARRARTDIIANAFRGTGFIEMYDGNYPSFVRAYTLTALMDNYSTAWHRDWAFRIDRGRDGLKTQVALDYKGKQVGEVVSGSVVLRHEFRYLTEAFVEAMIHAS